MVPASVAPEIEFSPSLLISTLTMITDGVQNNRVYAHDAFDQWKVYALSDDAVASAAVQASHLLSLSSTLQWAAESIDKVSCFVSYLSLALGVVGSSHVSSPSLSSLVNTFDSSHYEHPFFPPDILTYLFDTRMTFSDIRTLYYGKQYELAIRQGM